MAVPGFVVGLCRASYYISLLGLKIPGGLLFRASSSKHVLAFITCVWVPFLLYCHTTLLPKVQEVDAATAINVWHLVTALWITIPLLVVGAVILSFVNGRAPAVSFLTALTVVLCFHGFAIPRLAQTGFGNVLLHALFAFFEDMPIIGWIWCLGHVVQLQRHIATHQTGRERIFPTLKKGSVQNDVLVVGNAPTVVEGEPMGSMIDGFDQVVRFNEYTVSQPEYTGQKISYHFCNGRNFPTDSSVKAVCPLFNASLTHAVYLFMPHMEEAPKILSSLTSSKVSSWFIEEDRILSLRRKLGVRLWQIPTSGMVAVDAFLETRGKVTLHGFNFFQGKKIHYFKESPTQLITSWLERFVTHDPSCEKRWVEGLVKEGVVSFLSQRGKDDCAGEKQGKETGKKMCDDDEAELRRRTPGLVRTVLKDGFPSQFSL